MRPEAQKVAGRDGCGYLLVSCLAICLLLACNGVVAALLYTWLPRQGVSWSNHPRWGQTLLFVGPVLLIFLEWWLIDLCTGYGFGRWAGRNRQGWRSDKARSHPTSGRLDSTSSP